MFGCWDNGGGGFGSVPAILGPPRRVKRVRYQRDGLSDLGYDPRVGGLAVMPDGTCMQLGVPVSCQEEDPFAGFVGGNTGSSGSGGSNAGPSTGFGPPVYVPPTDTPISKPPVRPIKPKPPIHVPTTPPVSTGPVHYRHHWNRDWWRRHRIKRPHVEAPKPPIHPVAIAPATEICPIRGYVARAIPGVNEYQNFRCTPGQPVVIDAGLAAAGRADAYARHGLSGLDESGQFSSQFVSGVAWSLGAALVAYFLLRKK